MGIGHPQQEHIRRKTSVELQLRQRPPVKNSNLEVLERKVLVIDEQELHRNTEASSVSSPDQRDTEALNAIRPLCQMVIDINDRFPLLCLR